MERDGGGRTFCLAINPQTLLALFWNLWMPLQATHCLLGTASFFTAQICQLNEGGNVVKPNHESNDPYLLLKGSTNYVIIKLEDVSEYSLIVKLVTNSRFFFLLPFLQLMFTSYLWLLNLFF